MPLDLFRIALPVGARAIAAAFAMALTLSRSVDPKFKLLASMLRNADPENRRWHRRAKPQRTALRSWQLA
jgi:hypothetical protein